MQQLHPRAVWLFFFGSIGKFIPVGFFGIFALIIFISTIVSFSLEGTLLQSFSPVLFMIGFLLLILSFSYLIAKLSYRYWRYEIGEYAVKIEKGIIWKKYISIPYDRIQNVDIYRGILDRLLGLSDLQIQTAGYSGGRYGRGSEGRLPGLDPKIAEALREDLVKRLQGSRQGL